MGRLVHLDVENCSEKLLPQQSYAIKNQLGHPKPLLGFSEVVPYGMRTPTIDKTFPCMEANYPYAIKNQRETSKIPQIAGILRSKDPSSTLNIDVMILLWVVCTSHIHISPPTRWRPERTQFKLSRGRLSWNVLILCYCCGQ